MDQSNNAPSDGSNEIGSADPGRSQALAGPNEPRAIESSLDSSPYMEEGATARRQGDTESGEKDTVENFDYEEPLKALEEQMDDINRQLAEIMEETRQIPGGNINNPNPSHDLPPAAEGKPASRQGNSRLVRNYDPDIKPGAFASNRRAGGKGYRKRSKSSDNIANDPQHDRVASEPGEAVKTPGNTMRIRRPKGGDDTIISSSANCSLDSRPAVEGISSASQDDMKSGSTPTLPGAVASNRRAGGKGYRKRSKSSDNLGYNQSPNHSVPEPAEAVRTPGDTRRIMRQKSGDSFTSENEARNMDVPAVFQAPSVGAVPSTGRMHRKQLKASSSNHGVSNADNFGLTNVQSSSPTARAGAMRSRRPMRGKSATRADSKLSSQRSTNQQLPQEESEGSIELDPPEEKSSQFTNDKKDDSDQSHQSIGTDDDFEDEGNNNRISSTNQSQREVSEHAASVCRPIDYEPGTLQNDGSPLLEATLVTDDMLVQQPERTFVSKWIPDSAHGSRLCFGIVALLALAFVAVTITGIGQCTGSKPAPAPAPAPTPAPTSLLRTQAPTKHSNIFDHEVEILGVNVSTSSTTLDLSQQGHTGEIPIVQIIQLVSLQVLNLEAPQTVEFARMR